MSCSGRRRHVFGAPMRTPLLFHAAVLTVGVLACGQPVLMGTVASVGDKTDDFDGTWEFRKGNVKQACKGETSSTISLTDTGTLVDMEAGLGNTLTVNLRGCDFEYDVSGSEAYARPEQDCTIPDDGTGFRTTVTLDDGTFSVDGARLKLNETILHVKMKSTTGGATRDCTETWNGDLKKAPRGTTGSGGFPSGSTSSSSSSSSSGGFLCDDSCTWHGDGECDDGGSGATTTACTLGTDCTDCGVR